MSIVKKIDSRIDWIDANKGFAILVVVFYHVLLGLESAKIISSSFYLELCYAYFTALATPIFFLMSGYFIEKSIDRLGGKNFFKTALHFILYPYVLWSILQIFSKIIFSSYVNKETDLDLFKLFYAPHGQFWFLHSLFIAQTAYYFFYKFYKSKYLLVCFICFSFALLINEYETIANAIRAFSYLVLGAYCKENLDINKISKNNYLLGVSGLVFVVFGVLQVYLFAPMGLSNLQNIIGSISGALFVSIFFIRYRVPNLIHFFGKNSMYIFVLHIMYLVPVRVLLLKLDIADPILTFCLCSIAGIGLPILAAVILEYFKLSSYLGIKSTNVVSKKRVSNS